MYDVRPRSVCDFDLVPRGARVVRADMRERTLHPLFLVVLLVGMTLSGFARGSEPASSCTPFGNPPRPITGPAIVPTCPGGQVLGPWNDADGTPRYACLYESANASTAQPLPLVVYLHPSLFNAD